MGTLTITVVGDVSVGTKSKTFNFADADINRLVAWSQAAFPLPGFGPGSPVPAPTVAQALLSWAQSVVDQTKSDIFAYERSIVAPPPPMVVS